MTALGPAGTASVELQRVGGQMMEPISPGNKHFGSFTDKGGINLNGTSQ